MDMRRPSQVHSGPVRRQGYPRAEGPLLQSQRANEVHRGRRSHALRLIPDALCPRTRSRADTKACAPMVRSKGTIDAKCDASERFEDATHLRRDLDRSRKRWRPGWQRTRSTGLRRSSDGQRSRMLAAEPDDIRCRQLRLLRRVSAPQLPRLGFSSPRDRHCAAPSRFGATARKSPIPEP